MIKFIKKTNLVVEQISKHPQVFRLSGKEDIREAFITQHNLLLCRQSGRMISILYVWDTRRKPAKKPIDTK